MYNSYRKEANQFFIKYLTAFINKQFFQIETTLNKMLQAVNIDLIGVIAIIYRIEHA